MTAYQAKRGRRAAGERGAALIISLIMVFMLALMGVSAMRSSVLEQQMAINSILSSDVLQAAESANEVVLNDQANLARAYQHVDNEITIDRPLGENALFDSEVTLRYVSEGNGVGNSVDAGFGSSSFVSLRYVSSGIARLEEARASRQVDQGVYRSAPK